MDTLVYYSDNPNLGKKTVQTINGTTEYRVNCKRIKGEYHVMNKDCFLVEGTWYRTKSGLIDTDHETGEWFLVNNRRPDMVNGVVGFEGKKPVMGFFTRNPYKNVRVVIKGQMGDTLALNETLLIKAGYAERVSTGVWYSTDTVPANQLARIENELDHTGKGYNIEDNKQEYAQKRTLYDAFPLEVSRNAALYGKMLGDLTFGAELEAAKGYLPDNLQNQLGVVVCRDGSLKDENGRPGPEFVTIPLSGAKGIQALVNLGTELSKRTEVDLKCSYHIHLGNLDTNRLFLVSLFRLCYKIQNELFLMFPYYKANPEGIKGKNYNQKLPSLSIYSVTGLSKEEFDGYIDESYKKIFAWLADGHVPDNIFNRKVHKHPQADKWNRSKRYYWMNAMNTIFSERNTVEFRPHTPTTNPTKIVNWLFICNAIVRFAERNHARILTKRSTISVMEILDYYGEQFGERGRAVSAYLKAYVQSRKDRFVADYEKGDRVSEWEMKQDKKYTFAHGGIESLF